MSLPVFAVRMLTWLQLIEIWETYLMQLDAEDDEHPFGLASPPAGVVATSDSKDVAADRPQTSSTLESDETTDARAAAIATREMEE